MTGVEFKVDGLPMPFDGGAPYGFTWDSTRCQTGSYTLRAWVQWVDYSPLACVPRDPGHVHNSRAAEAPTGLTPRVTGDDVNLGWGAVDGRRPATAASATGARRDHDRDVVHRQRPPGRHAPLPRGGRRQDANVGQDSAAVSATIAPPPPSGLVAAYGFEETSGTA